MTGVGHDFDNAYFAKADWGFIIPRSPLEWQEYLDDAAHVLDLLAQEDGEYGCNPIGISILIGAMAQLVNEGYYGADNKPAKNKDEVIEMCLSNILTLSERNGNAESER